MKTLEITSCYYLFPGDEFLQDKQDQIPEILFYLCILRHKQDQILESWFFLCILRHFLLNVEKHQLFVLIVSFLFLNAEKLFLTIKPEIPQFSLNAFFLKSLF